MMPADAPPWFPLACAALTEAVLEHNDLAGRALQDLIGRFGPDVLPEVMMAWIDTLLARAPVPEGAFAGLAFVNAHSRRVTSADDVPPEVAWAGRLIVARANDDEPQLRALIDSVPSDADWSRNVSALLSSLAASLRRLGWADELRAAGHS